MTEQEFYDYLKFKFGVRMDVCTWLGFYWLAFKSEKMTLEEIEDMIQKMVESNGING
jgi:hypothetical protein